MEDRKLQFLTKISLNYEESAFVSPGAGSSESFTSYICSPQTVKVELADEEALCMLKRFKFSVGLPGCVSRPVISQGPLLDLVVIENVSELGDTHLPDSASSRSTLCDSVYCLAFICIPRMMTKKADKTAVKMGRII